MKTKQRQGFNMEKISNFFQVALAITTIGLMPLCLNASVYWNETISSIINTKNFIPVLLIIFGIVVNILLMKRQLRLQKKGMKKEFPHDGLEGLSVFYKISTIFAGIIFLAIAAFSWIIMETIQNNPWASLVIAILATSLAVGWMKENKKRRRELRYANKILMDKGLELIKE